MAICRNRSTAAALALVLSMDDANGGLVLVGGEIMPLLEPCNEYVFIRKLHDNSRWKRLSPSRLRRVVDQHRSGRRKA